MATERRPVPKRPADRQALLAAGFTPLQCHDCNAEFWCNDRWELHCAACAPANEAPRISGTRRVKTHAELMEAGAAYDQMRRQVHAREGQS